MNYGSNVLLDEDKVIRAMTKKGLTREGLCAAARCSYSSLRNALKGRVSPSKPILTGICEALGVSPQQISKGSYERSSN